MIIRIFNKTNSLEYKAFLDVNGITLDIYYYPEFLDIEANVVGGEFEIFTIGNSKSREVFIYPYIKIWIRNYPEHFDIVSPYGYAGPYSSNEYIFIQGEKEFLNYLRTQNALTEFVRYHFVYNEKMKFKININNELNRSLIVMDLRKDWDDILLNEISMNNRNYYRKLKKEGYTFEIDYTFNYLGEFTQMYNDTMKHANASHNFLFDKHYFDKLVQNLKDKIRLARITKEGITYSAVLFFISGSVSHYYLMGRNLDYPKIPATILLYIEVAKWAKENSIDLINMGGGITNSPDDPLFKFKKNYSKETKPFYIGKRIHNVNLYNQIKDDWINSNGKEKFDKIKHLLQFYHV